MPTELYYEKIVDITRDYLGPAASRFVIRQINTHFHKSPEQLQRTDIPILAIRIRKWSRRPYSK